MIIFPGEVTMSGIHQAHGEWDTSFTLPSHTELQWKRQTVIQRLLICNSIISWKAFLSGGSKEDCSHRTPGEQFGRGLEKSSQAYTCTVRVIRGEITPGSRVPLIWSCSIAQRLRASLKSPFNLKQKSLFLIFRERYSIHSALTYSLRKDKDKGANVKA